MEAARLPERPASPNIPAILLIGLVLGLGSGVGFAAVKESSDTTVHSLEQLISAVAFPALVAIPEIVTPKDISRRNMKRGFAVGTLIAFVALSVVLVHFFVMDLDVLWARLARRMPL